MWKLFKLDLSALACYAGPAVTFLLCLIFSKLTMLLSTYNKEK